MLAYLRHGRPATGFDGAVGLLLRAAGVVGLLLLAFGLFAAGAGAWTLLRMQAEGDRTGWDGLIGAIALMLGVMMVVGGAVLSTGAHAAFSGWREGRARPVRVAGWVFVAVGALASVPGAIAGTDTPLDLYVLVAGAAVAALGIVLLTWAAGPAARGPDEAGHAGSGRS